MKIYSKNAYMFVSKYCVYNYSCMVDAMTNCINFQDCDDIEVSHRLCLTGKDNILSLLTGLLTLCSLSHYPTTNSQNTLVFVFRNSVGIFLHSFP